MRWKRRRDLAVAGGPSMRRTSGGASGERAGMSVGMAGAARGRTAARRAARESCGMRSTIHVLLYASSPDPHLLSARHL